jgi:hypothetical protein
MSTHAIDVDTRPAGQFSPPSLTRLHVLLAVQSANVVLVSVNRLSTLTTRYVAANEFLRWVDLINLLVVPLISVSVSYLIKHDLEAQADARNPVIGRWLANLLFVIGVYLLGAGYGAHEVTNYLHGRFCLNGDEFPLCGIIAFNDDEFSHWVFFAGFVLMNAALMALQALLPHRGKLSARDAGLIAFNGLFIALGVFANLAFETIGLDLYVVALLALLAIALLWRMRSQPLLIYFAVAFGIGLVATFVYKGFRFA